MYTIHGTRDYFQGILSYLRSAATVWLGYVCLSDQSLYKYNLHIGKQICRRENLKVNCVLNV